jgi:excisionase family DNA binding protein
MTRLVTINELAHALRLTPGTIRNKLARGADLPPSIRLGRRRLFSQEQIDAWLKAREVPKAPTSITRDSGQRKSGATDRPQLSTAV